MAVMGDTPDTDLENIVTELDELGIDNVDNGDIVRAWGKTVIACRCSSIH